MTLLLSLAVMATTLYSCSEDDAPSGPTITSLSTDEAEIGYIVVILGTNFGTSTADVTVTFGTAEATPMTVVQSAITVEVPEGATSGALKVKVGTKEITGDDFKILASEGIMAYFPFNGDGGDAYSSLTSTVSGPTLTTDRFNNPESAYSFDGVDDFISAPDQDVYRFGNGDFTISFWALFSDTQRGVILSKRNDNPAGSFEQYTFFVSGDASLNSTGDGLGYFVRTGNSETRNGIVANYDDGKWHKVVYVSSYEDGLKMYIDGTKVAESTQAFTGGVSASGKTLYIGIMNGNSYPFKGKIDEIRLYNRALATTEF